ncbi:MAG: FkbM family methyltransferase [Planctomycetota bacterium]
MARDDDLMIVDEVFSKRRYATLFPFKAKANILDIGAHCGYFSAFASIHAHQDSRILALEPDEGNFQLAKRNLEENGIHNVELVPSGVYGKTQTLELTVHPGSSAQHTVFPRKSAHSALTERRAIEVVSMEDLFTEYGIGKCDFMKIDCEGAEYPFFYEAPADLLQSIETISMEFHDVAHPDYTGTQMATYLAGHGFSVVSFCYLPTRSNLNYGLLLVTRKW